MGAKSGILGVTFLLLVDTTLSVRDEYDHLPLSKRSYGCVPFVVACACPVSAIFATSSLFSCLTPPFAVPEVSFAREPLTSVSSE